MEVSCSTQMIIQWREYCWPTGPSCPCQCCRLRLEYVYLPRHSRQRGKVEMEGQWKYHLTKLQCGRGF